MKVMISLLAVVLLFVTGCGNKDYENLKKRYDATSQENARLKPEIKAMEEKADALEKELQEEKFSPARLLRKANMYLELKLEDKAYTVLLQLERKHPESEEGKKAGAMVKKIEVEREKIAKVKRAKARRRLGGLTSFRSGKDVHYMSSHFGYGKETGINAFIVVTKGDFANAVMYFSVKYVGYNKLNVREFRFGTDKGGHSLETPSYDISHKRLSNFKTETKYFERVKLKHKKIIESIIASKSASVVFVTHNTLNMKSHHLTAKEIKGLKQIFEIYDGLSGKYSAY